MANFDSIGAYMWLYDFNCEYIYSLFLWLLPLICIFKQNPTWSGLSFRFPDPLLLVIYKILLTNPYDEDCCPYDVNDSLMGW